MLHLCPISKFHWKVTQYTFCIQIMLGKQLTCSPELKNLILGDTPDIHDQPEKLSEVCGVQTNDPPIPFSGLAVTSLVFSIYHSLKEQ